MQGRVKTENQQIIELLDDIRTQIAKVSSDIGWFRAREERKLENMGRMADSVPGFDLSNS
jgi:hypothetical protein